MLNAFPLLTSCQGSSISLFLFLSFPTLFISSLTHNLNLYLLLITSLFDNISFLPKLILFPFFVFPMLPLPYFTPVIVGASLCFCPSSSWAKIVAVLCGWESLSPELSQAEVHYCFCDFLAQLKRVNSG